MKPAKILKVCGLAFLLGLSAATASDADFTVLTDIPVLEGLIPVPDTFIVFDKEEGRIIEATFKGPLALSEVLAFYRETLFQLGWEIKEESGAGQPLSLTFIKEGEQLTLEAEEGAALTVRLRLGPNL